MEPIFDPATDPECWDRDDDSYQDEACGGLDCDDLDPTIHPGAHDLCDDGIDQDCDGRDATDGVRGPNLTLLEYIESGERHFSELAWTGREYAYVWIYMGDSINVDWIDAAGKGVREEVYVREYEHAYDIVWSGSVFGSAWSAETTVDGCNLFYQALDGSGAPMRSEVQVTHSNAVAVNGSDYYGPVVLPVGEEFGLLWLDERDGGYQVYFTRVTVDGEKLLEDVQVTHHSESVDGGLTAAWTGSEIGIIWRAEASRRPMRDSVNLVRVGIDGGTRGAVEVLSLTSAYSETPVILWAGSEYGIFWTEPIEEPRRNDLILSRRGPDGSEIDRVTVMTTEAEWRTREMKAVWTGTEYVMLWSEFESGYGLLHVQRISRLGIPIDPRIEIPVEFNTPSWPLIVWSGFEFGVCWTEADYPVGDSQRIHTFFNRVGFCD